MRVHEFLKGVRRPSAVTIGNFDGFHLGHASVIRELARLAKARESLSVAVTFSPHPRLFFRHPLFLIFTDGQKRKILRQQPVDRLLFLDFSRFQAMEAHAFIEDVLIDRLRMGSLVFSGDFLFGSQRTGNVGLLRQLSSRHGFEIEEVPPVTIDGERVSSSAIRKKLQAGEIVGANRMLGREYAIEGMVGRGEGRGKRLGYPTINIVTENRILPGGVFRTRTEIGKRLFPSVTHIGVRPTFSVAGALQVESHIPGFRGNLYGRRVRIHFQDKIRDEMRFSSEEQLQRQIAADIAAAGIG